MKALLSKTKKTGNLPNCIIIGAQKSGTSSLFHYLSFHPEVVAASHKELNFFNKELCWEKGLNWYKSHFIGPAKVYIEASPSYTNFPLFIGVAKKMHSIVPQAKLIYIVRDPIERMVSQYLDLVKGGYESRTIEEAFKETQDSHYIWFSKYYSQIEMYLKFYPKESFLFLSAEELKNNRLKTLKKVFRFLDLDDSFTCEAFNDLINVSDSKLKRKKPRRIVRFLGNVPRESAEFQKFIQSLIPKYFKNRMLQAAKTGKKILRPKISHELTSMLISYLKEDISRFRELSGSDFKEWCF